MKSACNRRLSRLAEIHVPTLLMIGDLDLPDRLALTHQLANQITGAHLAIIPGVAHMVHIEQPEEFTRLVLRFLSQEEERFSFFGQSTRGIGKTVLGAL